MCVYECAWYHNTFLVRLSLGSKAVLYCIVRLIHKDSSSRPMYFAQHIEAEVPIPYNVRNIQGILGGRLAFNLNFVPARCLGWQDTFLVS